MQHVQGQGQGVSLRGPRRDSLETRRFNSRGEESGSEGAGALLGRRQRLDEDHLHSGVLRGSHVLGKRTVVVEANRHRHRTDRVQQVEQREFLVGGRWCTSSERTRVVYPYTGEVVAEVANATPEDMEAAIAGAVHAFQTTRKLPVASAEWAPGANPTMVAPITTASTTIEAKMDLPCMNPPFLCAGRDRAKTLTAVRGKGQSRNARAP